MDVRLATGASREKIIKRYQAARARVEDVEQQIDGFDGKSYDRDTSQGNVLVENLRMGMFRTKLCLGRKESSGDTQVMEAKFYHKEDGSLISQLFGRPTGGLFSKFAPLAWEPECWKSQERPGVVTTEYYGPRTSFTFIEDAASGTLTLIEPTESTRVFLQEQPPRPEVLTEPFLQGRGVLESSSMSLHRPPADTSELGRGGHRKLKETSIDQLLLGPYQPETCVSKQVTFKNGFKLEQNAGEGQVTMRKGDEVLGILEGADLYLPEKGKGKIATRKAIEEKGLSVLNEIYESGWVVLRTPEATAAISPEDGSIVQWIKGLDPHDMGRIRTSFSFAADGSLSGNEGGKRGKAPLVELDKNGNVLWKSSRGERLEVRPLVKPQEVQQRS